jgi:hypothetical protein
LNSSVDSGMITPLILSFSWRRVSYCIDSKS